MILAGHGRVEAAKLLGLADVPVIRISDLSEAQKRAYVLADNKLAARAGWDKELLALELGELSLVLPDLGLSVELTGFAVAEIDQILARPKKAKRSAQDDMVFPPAAIPVTQPGGYVDSRAAPRALR